MVLPARQFYLYLTGLSTKSRWVTAMTNPAPVARTETVAPTPAPNPIIRDKAKATSILFGPWQDVRGQQ